MKKTILLLFISIFYQSVFAQKSGYWDKERATYKEVVVSARDRVIVETDDFPAGTTELIYRITLLDDNQQMAGSLVSILKSIPDPTGISQGSAGAVFLMSKISGDDKCKYAIFSTNELAKAYGSKGETAEACLAQNTAVSKDAKRLSIDKSTCVKSNTTKLYFGFESSNWIMKQKIILEVVLWVDAKLSRGWTLENRKNIISQCKTSALARKMANSDDFCVCIEEKIQKQYSFQEFQKLLPMEQSKAYKDFGASCFEETGIANNVFNDLRTKASNSIKKGDYSSAIKNYNEIVIQQKATALDYANLGYGYLMTKQYGKAIKSLKDGEKLDDTELLVKLNLAHAYLLNNEYGKAKTIYKEYQNQNQFRLKMLLRFEDFEKVLKMLK